jgi:hypothetical protein
MEPARRQGDDSSCRSDLRSNIVGTRVRRGFWLGAGRGIFLFPVTTGSGISKFNVFMEPKEYSHPIKSLLTILF